MTKKKKEDKAKEPIRLRFKALANGNKSLYLDTYKDGKRAYEFLRLYLIPETDEAAKVRNMNTLQTAIAIKSQRTIEFINNGSVIKNTSTRSKMLLLDWMRFADERRQERGLSKTSHEQMTKTVKRLIEYKGEAVTMKEVDKDYCLGFIRFLNNARRKDGRLLAKETTATYFKILNTALNMAVEEEVIQFNPITKISDKDRIKVPDSTREYLTVDEVKQMIASPCGNEATKQAYLFSCFCGFRLSDIKALEWGDIILDGNQYRAKIIMQKTREPLSQPLSKEAVRWMPERGTAKDTDKVFKLPSKTAIRYALKKWAAASGLKKLVTFHTARHTFATMMLTLGADIYTVSKLLGHKDVKITEIYTKVVDKKKDEAVNLTDGVFEETKNG